MNSIRQFLADPSMHKNWVLLTGLLLMAGVHAANRYGLKEKIGAKYVPSLTVLMGTMLAIGDKFITSPELPWGDTLSQGFLAGIAATGLWELVFKNISSPTPPTTTPSADP